MSESESGNMAAAIVESRYLSAGANRHAAVADWGEDGFVAFGSDTNVCLWSPAVSDVMFCSFFFFFLFFLVVVARRAESGS